MKRSGERSPGASAPRRRRGRGRPHGKTAEDAVEKKRREEKKRNSWTAVAAADDERSAADASQRFSWQPSRRPRDDSSIRKARVHGSNSRGKSRRCRTKKRTSRRSVSTSFDRDSRSVPLVGKRNSNSADISFNLPVRRAFRRLVLFKGNI